MRIAYFTDTYQPQINGVTKTLGKLKSYLEQKGHSHKFLAPAYPQDDISSPSLMRFKSVVFPLYPECRLSIPLFPLMAKKLDSYRPQLIHLVTPLGIGLAGLRYATERNIPVVSSFHTYFDSYLKYYHLQNFEPLLWNFFKTFHNQTSITFCPSEDTKEILKSKGIRNLKLWSRGIDNQKFSPRFRCQEFMNGFTGNPSSHSLKILYAGRIAAEKDLDILMESIRTINIYHENNVEFFFVGDGPYLKTLSSNAPANVFFTGYLQGQSLSKAFASCDIFAFPSGTETLGNVVLEAMASGLPVVAVNSGGVKDNVIDGFNGLLAPHRDTCSFAQCLFRLIEDSVLRSMLKRNALDFVKHKSWNRIFDQLIFDYQLALEKQSSKILAQHTA